MKVQIRNKRVLLFCILVSGFPLCAGQLKEDKSSTFKMKPSNPISVPCSPLGIGKLAVRTPPLTVSYHKLEGYEAWFSAEGRWTKVAGKGQGSLPLVNTVSISCDPRKCEEIMAIMVTDLDDDYRESVGLFYTQVAEYKVIRWSPPSVVVAVAEARAADVTITLTPEHGTAERVLQETEARGAKRANPVPWRWRLE